MRFLTCRLLGLAAGLTLAVDSLAAAERAPEQGASYARLGFDVLASFPIDQHVVNSAPAEAKAKAIEQQIPPAIRQWDQREVSITGFMMPERLEKGLVTEFLLMPFTAAAMNTPNPAISEWVRVRVKLGVPPHLQFPVTCQGTFKVGPVFENGYLTAIYRLDAEKVVPP